MYANVMYLQLLAPLKCMKLERRATNENWTSNNKWQMKLQVIVV